MEYIKENDIEPEVVNELTEVYMLDDLGICIGSAQKLNYKLQDSIHYTLIPPPPLGKDEAAKFDRKNKTWSLVKDHRGQIAYDSLGNVVVISSLGEINGELSLERPNVPARQKVVDNLD